MKNFDYVLGQKYNELTILSYTPPLKDKRHHRDCTCQCSCGKEVTLRLSKVIRGEILSCGHLQVDAGRRTQNLDKEKSYQARTSKDVPQSNTTTGIRNIAWLETEKKYRVTVTRHGKVFSERADTLKEAIECKRRLVNEAEEYFGEKIYKNDYKEIRTKQKRF